MKRRDLDLDSPAAAEAARPANPAIRQPLWLRLSHASNALAWLIMTLSGVMIYWANDVYTPFVGRAFYRTLGLDHKLALGLALHFTFMWLFTLTGVIYVCRLVSTGAWREIVPRASDWRQIPRVALAEIGLGAMPPSHGKLNPAQRCVYFGVLLIAALEVFCGLAIYKPFQLTLLQSLFGGYETARLIHFMVMLALVAFFLMHVAQVVRAGARDFFAMIIAVPVTPPTSGGLSPRTSVTASVSLSTQFRRVAITLAIWFAALALVFAWVATRSETHGVVWPLRQVLNFNGWVAKSVFRQNAHERIASSLEASIGGGSASFTPSVSPAAGPQGSPRVSPRVNGMIGLEVDPTDDDDVIQISEPGRPARSITVDELLSFKSTSTSAQFRCIEGWSQPISYKGVGFRDLMLATGFGARSGASFTERTTAGELYPYVGFETADHRYYVSIDIASLLHPQTVLATQMNGEDISEENGAPVRLVIPVKYGIKNIKRIKRIFFSTERPPDYWEERGYDWFAGL